MAQRLPVETANAARAQALLGRTASANDIANQVVTFCRAESVTGQVLVIDGGDARQQMMWKKIFFPSFLRAFAR